MRARLDIADGQVGRYFERPIDGTGEHEHRFD
jgi:hypothetical protein